MTEAIDILKREGKPLAGGAHAAFLLSDADSAWLIRWGQVYVFSVDVENGRPVGRRSYLFSAEAGDVLLGTGSAPSGGGSASGGGTTEAAALLAMPGPDTSLLEIPQSRLRELARDPAHADTVAAWVEKWTQGMASGLLRRLLTIQDYRELKVGQELELEDGQSVGTLEKILWVTHSQGRLRPLGRENIPFAEQNRFFPLVGRAWLVASGKTLVRGVTTKVFFKEDPDWAGLASFHRSALTLARIGREQVEKRDQSHLDATLQVDRYSLEHASHELASVLAPEAKAPMETAGDALLRACQMVGRASGIEIRYHPEGRADQKTDPLAAIANASRVRTRRVLLQQGWWRLDAAPMVAYMQEDNRPVALLPTRPGRYTLYDPSKRTRARVTSSVAAALAPFGYVFYRLLPDRPLSGKDLIGFGLFRCGRDVLRIALIALASGLLGLVTPIVTGLLFDTVIPGAKLDQLMEIVLALGVSAFAVMVFQIVRALAILRIEGKMDSSIEAAIWDRLLKLPLPFFRRFTAGDLAMRAMGVSIIRQALTGAVIPTVLDSVASVLSVALLFYYSWRLALLAVGILIVGLALSVIGVLLQFRYQRPLWEIQGKIQGLVLQFITGISKLRVAGAERRAFASWAKSFAEQKGLSYKSAKVTIPLSAFYAVLPVFSSILLFGLVFYCRKFSLLGLTAGDFLAFMSAFSTVLSGGIAAITTLMPVLMVAPLVDRLQPILQTLPEVGVTRPMPGELSGHIEVSHVSFRYTEDGPMVLKDVSVRFHPGELVAIVGPSGSGKSTLFRLLLGFEPPDSGSIYYDGQDIAEIDVQALRRQAGVVLQNSKLMAGTIFTNIVGASLLTMDDAWEAARLCGLAEDIEAMPMGMHTMVAEGGGGLSGGQVQRILIARAIVHKPRILFFDEATSALDNKTQAVVSQSLQRLKATRVVIAHRLTTIMPADRIYVIVDGRIAQTGTFAELLKEPGPFASIAKRQIV
jgi:ATP-binding cassette subfamily C protein